MSRIRTLLEFRAKSGQKSFIAYITAGDPTLDATRGYVDALIRAGADVIELGVPYSDPVADGPTNLKSAARALKSGVTLEGCIEFVRRLREGGVTVPIVLFTYFNPIFRMGFDRFATLSKSAGVDAVLAVDLPPEEASEYHEALSKNGVGTIFLASPTTDPKRVKLISQLSSEFIYYVSRTGVTGVQASLAVSLEAELIKMRELTSLPVAVGFGISTPSQAEEVSRFADAVVVGSALVKVLEENPESSVAKVALEKLAKSLCDAIRKGSTSI